MSLYSAFYSGLSGLSTNANALNVIGNNLSNINTVGFKGSDMTFRDIFSAAGSSQGNGNPIQFGLGVQMNSVNQNFSQSSFQTTGNALDMAIQGNGFFTLQTPTGTQVFSRAGNFTRDSSGFLVASDGSNVMGWNRSVVNNLAGVYPSGAASPIQISAATAGAQATQNVTLNVNLDASAAVAPAAGSTFSSPMQVYDSLGQVQNMVISYSKTRNGQAATSGISVSGTNLDSAAAIGSTYTPYNGTTTPLVTYDSLGVVHNLALTFTKNSGNPASAGPPAVAFAPDVWGYAITDGATTVGAGTLDYTSGPTSPALTVTQPLVITSTAGTSSAIAFDMSSITNSASANSAIFAQSGGVPSGNLTWTYTVGDAAVNPNGTPRPAAYTGSLQFNSSGNLVSLDGKLPVATNNPTITIPWLNGTSNNIAFDVIGTNGISNYTGLSSSSTTSSSTQDGYPAGTLQTLTVDQDGLISGSFTNGQILKLAQLALSSFTNLNGLQQAGNNHWSQTLASGAPTVGVANQGGRGAILGSNLELSNVDVASEFTKLITSQRGYEANSKIVTTTDQLLQVTLNLKQ